MSENDKLVIEDILASIGLEPLRIHDPKTSEMQEPKS